MIRSGKKIGQKYKITIEMKRFILWLTLGTTACTGIRQADLTGCWMEVLPPETPYEQGMVLNDDGTAESVGMATLKYQGWKKSDNRIILEGESIGNGQTISFSDTLHIVRLVGDTLTVERRNSQLSFVRKSKEDLALSAQPSDSRPAYDGFEWVDLSGAGLKLRVQQNENIRLMVDPSLPGVVMVRAGDAHPQKEIQLFDLKNNDINEVISTLETMEGWDKEQTCKFKEVPSKRPGVRRYVMVPDGEYATRINEWMQKEPVPVTCNGWGVGNSGNRYFEVHDSRPDKALFVEIGQDAPLFDENSIEFTSENSSGLSPDILYTLEGVLCMGHEVRSFKPDGSEEEFWFVDKTGTLDDLYDKTTGGQKNGKPVKATLKVEYNGKWDDGFAADYDGVYLVREILRLE